MDKGDKRSFSQMESSSADEYVYSANDHHNLGKLADKRLKFNSRPRNCDLDANSKIVALDVAPYIVSIVSFSGEAVLFEASGTIIEVEENNNTVLTSLNLIRRPTEAEVAENSLADNLKIVVRSSDEKSYLAEIYTYDFHYNLLIIKFKSKDPLSCAKLRTIDDDLDQAKSFQLRPHTFKIKAGDSVLVVGRFFCESFDLMAATGRLRDVRYDPSEFECRELWSSTCAITMCGDGSPVINLSGEVIGVAFFDTGASSPFLPMNVCSKWWDHYKTYTELRHPSYGFETGNLYAAELRTLERLLQKFPSISNGLVVDKVLSGSYAESAGLQEDDIIIKFTGKSVNSFLQLWDLMWENVGEAVELEVFRADLCALLNISMMVGEATPNELNKWPRFDHP